MSGGRKSQSVNSKEQCSVPDALNCLGEREEELSIDMYQTADDF